MQRDEVGARPTPSFLGVARRDQVGAPPTPSFLGVARTADSPPALEAHDLAMIAPRYCGEPAPRTIRQQVPNLHQHMVLLVVDEDDERGTQSRALLAACPRRETDARRRPRERERLQRTELLPNQRGHRELRNKPSRRRGGGAPPPENQNGNWTSTRGQAAGPLYMYMYMNMYMYMCMYMYMVMHMYMYIYMYMYVHV